MKKFLSLVLSVMLIVSLVPMSASALTEIGEDATVTIAGSDVTNGYYAKGGKYFGEEGYLNPHANFGFATADTDASWATYEVSVQKSGYYKLSATIGTYGSYGMEVFVDDVSYIYRKNVATTEDELKM